MRWATVAATATRTTIPLGVVPQQYLPDEAIDATLYRPGDHGEESEIGERLSRIDRILGRQR